MIDKDEAVVQAVQSGDKESFARLVDRHKQRVYAILVRLTGDPLDAEELAHEAFVRAYRGLGRFRGEASFGTWLVQIAIHLVRDRVRERRRSRTVSLDALLELDADAPVLAETRAAYDPLAEVNARDLNARLERALQELPLEYREVFVLHHVQDMPYETIAELTGNSVGSLKVRAHRARKLLKENLFPDVTRLTPEDIVE